MPTDLERAVERLRELEAKATPAPWHIVRTYKGNLGDSHLHVGAESSPMVLASMNPVHVDTIENIELLTELRNALPLLLAAVDEMQNGEPVTHRYPDGREFAYTIKGAAATIVELDAELSRLRGAQAVPEDVLIAARRAVMDVPHRNLDLDRSDAGTMARFLLSARAGKAEQQGSQGTSCSGDQGIGFTAGDYREALNDLAEARAALRAIPRSNVWNDYNANRYVLSYWAKPHAKAFAKAREDAGLPPSAPSSSPASYDSSAAREGEG